MFLIVFSYNVKMINISAITRKRKLKKKVGKEK